MKRMILMLVFAFLTIVNSSAQNGNVNVINRTTCDIAINLVAVCPNDCSEYSALAMTPVPPIFFPGYQYLPNWTTPDPETICPGQWIWSYAQIFYSCGGPSGYGYIDIGNPLSPCNIYPSGATITIPQECADQCNNGKTTFEFYWSQVGNNVTITVL